MSSEDIVERLNLLNLSGEIWRPLTILTDGRFELYEEYQVSNKGRVRRGDEMNKLPPNDQGYLRAWIRNKSERVNRLVAATFLRDQWRPWYTMVDHIDSDDIQNNCVENLRWTTNTLNNYNSKVKKGYIKQKNGKFTVRQKFQSKITNHGTYESEADAKQKADGLRKKRIEALLWAYSQIDKMVDIATESNSV